jgi:hypothetical protein
VKTNAKYKWTKTSLNSTYSQTRSSPHHCFIVLQICNFINKDKMMYMGVLGDWKLALNMGMIKMKKAIREWLEAHEGCKKVRYGCVQEVREIMMGAKSGGWKLCGWDMNRPL